MYTNRQSAHSGEALEGWSAQKPVVSTKRGGPAEFVWHGVNGLQVDDTPGGGCTFTISLPIAPKVITPTSTAGQRDT